MILNIKRHYVCSARLTDSTDFFVSSFRLSTQLCSNSFTMTRSLYSHRNTWLVHVTDDCNIKTTGHIKLYVYLVYVYVQRKPFPTKTTANALTVSGPTTFDGGNTDRFGLRNSGPGLLRDRRFRVACPKSSGWAPAPRPRAPDRTAPPSLPIGLAARSRPCWLQNVNYIVLMFMYLIS